MNTTLTCLYRQGQGDLASGTDSNQLSEGERPCSPGWGFACRLSIFTPAKPKTAQFLSRAANHRRQTMASLAYRLQLKIIRRYA